MSCDESIAEVAIKMKKSCCSDKQIKGAAQQFHKSPNIKISKINFTLNFIPQQNEIVILNRILKKGYFIGYSPPLQTFNLNNLYQVYRI